MKNISQLTQKQISLINEYLETHKQNTFSHEYILGMQSYFGEEMQAYEEFIFRGRFVSTLLHRHTIDNKAVQHGLSITSSTSAYSRIQVLLLDDEFKPIKIMHTSMA